MRRREWRWPSVILPPLAAWTAAAAKKPRLNGGGLFETGKRPLQPVGGYALPTADGTREYSADDRERGHVAGHDGPGRDHRARSQCDAGQDDRPHTDEDVVLDPDRFRLGSELVVIGRVLGGQDGDARRDADIAPDPEAATRVKAAVTIDMRPLRS